MKHNEKNKKKATNRETIGIMESNGKQAWATLYYPNLKNQNLLK